MSGYFDTLNRKSRKVALLPPRELPAPAPSLPSVPPQAARAPRPVRPASPPTEYIGLREKLLAAANGRPFKTLVFAGCAGGEGTTQVVSEYAQALASSGLKVLLVDADARTSGLTAHMAATGTDLTALVNKGARGTAIDCGKGQLTIVPSPTSASDKEHFFRTPEFAAWLDDQRGSYDYVLLDAPPLLQFADGILMGRLSDGVVIIAQAETTERDALVRARDQLQRAGVNVVGVVLNRARNPIPASLRAYLSIE
jgi:Mrp family chromosome partitioning ATPase